MKNFQKRNMFTFIFFFKFFIIYSYIYLFIYIFIYLFLHLFIYLFIYLFIGWKSPIHPEESHPSIVGLSPTHTLFKIFKIL